MAPDGPQDAECNMDLVFGCRALPKKTFSFTMHATGDRGTVVRANSTPRRTALRYNV